MSEILSGAVCRHNGMRGQFTGFMMPVVSPTEPPTSLELRCPHDHQQPRRRISSSQLKPYAMDDRISLDAGCG